MYITTDEIRQLRQEAAEAGDLEQVAFCDAALEGDSVALVLCSEVIRIQRAAALADRREAAARGEGS